MAEDHIAAMERAEQRLEIVPVNQKEIEVVKVQEPAKLFQLIERFQLLELRLEECLDIVGNYVTC